MLIFAGSGSWQQCTNNKMLNFHCRCSAYCSCCNCYFQFFAIYLVFKFYGFFCARAPFNSPCIALQSWWILKQHEMWKLQKYSEVQCTHAKLWSYKFLLVFPSIFLIYWQRWPCECMSNLKEFAQSGCICMPVCVCTKLRAFSEF